MIEARRIPFISEFEQFFHQGVDAFSIFTGFDVTDKMALSVVCLEHYVAKTVPKRPNRDLIEKVCQIAVVVMRG